jgi:hypothetical protein
MAMFVVVVASAMAAAVVVGGIGNGSGGGGGLRCGKGGDDQAFGAAHQQSRYLLMQQ